MTTTQRPVRVLVVDDSALIRQLLSELIGRAPDMEVVGAARDPYDARAQIKALNPDVLTLDVEMPKMDGLVFLRNLMRLRPMPVVMVSSLTREGAEETLEALALGAVDFLPKPQVISPRGSRRTPRPCWRSCAQPPSRGRGPCPTRARRHPAGGCAPPNGCWRWAPPPGAPRRSGCFSKVCPATAPGWWSPSTSRPASAPPSPSA